MSTVLGKTFLEDVMRYDFEDLSKLPIQDCHLYDCAASGHRAARDLKCSIDDCPWGASRDQRIRCYRIAWRTAFRRARKLRSGQAPAHSPFWIQQSYRTMAVGGQWKLRFLSQQTTLSCVTSSPLSLSTSCSMASTGTTSRCGMHSNHPNK
jgi:hypothetical protein